MKGLLVLSLLALPVDADPYESFYGVDGKNVFVQLFDWKYSDVAKECEGIVKFGYGGVQVSPPNDHLYLVQYDDQPWWVDYQPISYEIISRRGNRTDFQNMVDRCNAAGVRVIVNAVINHMAARGMDYGEQNVGSWGNEYYNADNEVFPVYSSADFNDPYCNRDISQQDYTCCADNVRRCRLDSLDDLNHDTDYVQSTIAKYFNDLISMGVAGFRIDAAKHMYPNNIAAILAKTNNLRSDIFGSGKRPFSDQEVIDYGGEAVSGSEYVNQGRISNFRAGRDITNAVRRNQNFKYLANWGQGWYPWAENDVVTFIDDHDTQRDSSHDVLYYADGNSYILAVGFLLAKNYGVPRVMSSYSFYGHDQGPPSDANWIPKSPTYNSDETCNTASGWQCEHRWPQIRRMVAFHNIVNDAGLSQVVNDEDNRLAFARTGKGFWAINNDWEVWSRTFQTSLPAGVYCDNYNGNGDNKNCQGTQITVNADGTAHVSIGVQQFIAIAVSA